MKALCVSTGRTVAPFGDPVSQAQVGAGSLAEAQVAALFAAGFEPVRAAPVDEPYLVYSDRTWFTPALLEAVRRAGPGRVRIADPRWWAWTGALQDVPEPGLYELGIRTGPPGFADLEPVDLQLELHELELDALHPAVAHGHSDPLFVGPAMAHQLDHWTHIGRINQLVLVARMEAAKLEWEEAGFFRRLFKVLGILLKARSFSGAKIAASLNERAKNVEIHPSAVVELCVLGEGVKIGPHAVVRGSILGPGAKVDPFATVNASVLGAGARAGRYAYLNLCTLYPGAMVSKGDGYQVSVFGEKSFMAWGATALDLSFGGPVKVESDGVGSERVSCGQHFMGVAVGHRAVVGNAVRLRYGVSIPNNGMVVDPGDDLLRQWGDGPVGEPVVVVDGEAVAVTRDLKA
jgi:hypothetical protein